VAGETTEAFDERQRIVGLLRHWSLSLNGHGGMWAGVAPTHAALLAMLADVFDGPRQSPPLAWTPTIKGD
jgi:hypothetical protein